MDNAATTRISRCALRAMEEAAFNCFGNPSARHSYGREAEKVIREARRAVAELMNADPSEVYFTGGGSESDNTILRGAVLSMKKKGKHVITTAIEHHAVLHTLEDMQENGIAGITMLPVRENGIIDPEEIRKAIRPDTVLVSVMFANNETGAVQPIRPIGALCRQRGVLFHTDAVQAYSHIPIDVRDMNIDFLALAGHKMHAPKGIGAMYIRKGIQIPPLIRGGGQEHGMRAGTENVPGIAALGAAAREAAEQMESSAERQRVLRDYLIDDLTRNIPGCVLNGDRDRRLPNNVNVSFEGVTGQNLVAALDLRGIAVSAGSACTAGSVEPSHVLMGMGLSRERALGALRLTISGETTEKEVREVSAVLQEVVRQLRGKS
ncbi:MAG: cysteine desulfurase [Lachnospiraceae bacterium]|nr:cysteine desulfurase [Lachnospiraceae bacterium]